MHRSIAQVLSVNTVIYSTHHCNSGPAFACENDGTAEPATAPLDPLGQFAWLTDQLLGARSKNSKVYILGHIPPVVSSFDREMFWKQPFADRYHDVVAEFADVIVAQLFGHTHSDEWRVENPGKDVAHPLTHPRPPLFISSAITPVYNNRPSFKRVTYNLTSKALLSYAMYTPTGWESGIDSLGQAQDWVWGEQMTTGTTLQLPSLEASELYALSERFVTDDAVWTAYINTTFKAGVHDTAACNSTCRHSWKCLYGTVTKHDYDLCMATAAPEPDGADRAVVVAVAVAAAAAVLLVLCVGMVAVRGCRKRSGRYGVFIEEAGDQELLLLSDVTRNVDFVRPQARRRPDATAYPLPSAVEPAEGSVVDALTFPEPNPAAPQALTPAAVPAPVSADPGLNLVPDARHDGVGRTSSSASIRSAVYESE